VEIDRWEDELDHYDGAVEPTMPELMSAAEIGHELGVSRQQVHKLSGPRLLTAYL
jgi:hypothetical protein